MKFSRKIVSLILLFFLLTSTLSVPASAAGTLVQGIGFVDATSLRLRSEASTSSSILATAYDQECVVVLEKIGSWYRVLYNLKEGYMHEDYLSVSNRENAELGCGQINGTGVNLRSGPSTSHSVVKVASSGDSCYIIGINEGWYKVIYQNTTCYVRSDFVTLKEVPYENRASSNTPKYFRGGKAIGALPSANTTGSSGSAGNTGFVSGNVIIQEAKNYLGCPYRAGGASPSGFDCSGFVYYVLKQVGLSPARTPDSQFSQGTPIEKSQLQPGDIVFFAGTYSSGISHVGIYAGNGQFIHAPNSRTAVSYSSLTSGYWANHYYGARRMA